MFSISVRYEVGWLPGIFNFPVLFTDQSIIFYNRQKNKQFELEDTRIDYVDLSYVLFGTLWCELWLKSSPLTYLEKDKAEDLKTWFPDVVGRMGNFTYISFKTEYKHKDQIIDKFKASTVKLGTLPFSNHTISSKT